MFQMILRQKKIYEGIFIFLEKMFKKMFDNRFCHEKNLLFFSSGLKKKLCAHFRHF